MADYAVTGNAVNISAGPQLFVQESVLDFSTTNLGINEDIDVFQIPANTVVTSVGYEIITASTGAGEIDLGDSASAVAFIDSADGDAADGAFVHVDRFSDIAQNQRAQRFDAFVEELLLALHNLSANRQRRRIALFNRAAQPVCVGIQLSIDAVVHKLVLARQQRINYRRTEPTE